MIKTFSALAALIAVFAVSSAAMDVCFAQDAPAPLHLVRTIALPGAQGWDYVMADSRAHRLYVTRADHVSVIDTQTGKLIGDITGLTGVHGVAIDPATGNGFITEGRINSVAVFNTKTLAKVADISVDQGPDAILYDPATRHIFTFNGRASTSTVIDPATNRVLGAIALPGRPEFAVSDGKGHIFDNIEDKSQIAEIDAKSMRVASIWPLAPGESPSGLAIDIPNHTLYTVCDNQQMIALDARTGKIVKTLPIGNGPDAAGFDASLRRVYSPNGEDGTMTVYTVGADGGYGPAMLATTEPGARTMAIDSKTHHVFTCTAKASATPAPGTRRSYVDGSFVVLEYAP